MLEKYYKQAIDDAINSLKDDGVIIVPTDTVYGLAALSSSKIGIQRIYEIKKRDSNKLLPLIVNSYAMLEKIAEIDINIIKKLSKYFPGPLTVVCRRKNNFEYYGAPTIAIRMIDSPLINKIIESVGEPLALTSANISTKGEVKDPMELLEMFDGCIDCVFLDGKVKGDVSTIIEILDDGNIKLIREGKISFDKILKEYFND